MKHGLLPVLISALVILLVAGCGKESESLPSPALADYYPLSTGKWFLYRLDSTLPASFGTSLITKSYQAKDTIESTFIDAEGRTSFRIFRFVRDTAGTQNWRFAATYVATPTREKIEYVDNNLRFVKLVLPFSENYTWKGNSFIETENINSPVTYLYNWDYSYASFYEPYHVLNKTYDSTITVLQHDELSPNVPFDPSLLYQQKIYSTEVYAKGIGLVYKDFLYWTWQSSPPPSKYEDASFGVRLRLISHN